MKQQYNKINNLVGWITFVIAAFTYCMTIEPTASFWDCPEFITTGYKLEVGHPPGAPFFMLTANLFSQFASDPSQVAMMVNIMSALMSAACILFLFWSITHLTRKLICPDLDQLTKGKLISIMGAGVVGALAYTWSDTFWFSAVEGEVYAYSSLFTAIVFWLILKWENRADEPHSDRWLILIAYLTGLSIGVHLLNLLCIPAIVLVYYYKKHPQANLKGSLLALVGSMILVAAVLYGIVPGIVKVGGWFELLFVNSFGMPFNTGVIVYLAVLVASLVWGVYESYTQKSRKRMNISFLLTVGLLGIPFYGHGTGSVVIGIIVLAILAIYLFANLSEKYRVSARTLNTSLLAMMMIVVGYSSYAVIVIRSSANTPMDQNSPEDIFTLGEYLGREQYGTRPLFYGQTYASKPALKQVDGGCMYDVTEGAPVYQRKEKERPDEKDSYEIVRNKTEYKYAQNMLFPRMWSSDHASAYEQWLGGVEGKQVPYDQCGEMIMVKVPTQWDNIKFFFIYQLNYMYWRYFMWNFAGRQNDIQGQGEIEHGNWITGIPFIDNALVGDQTWDDHDRSGRYTCRDFGQNYLSTVPEKGNPILFTNGDNDTFPLWYNQETEGFRTDVRVCNLSYLQTDWYIDQMRRPAYDSPSAPINWERIDYVSGHNEAVYVRPEAMSTVMNYYKQNPEEAKQEFGDNPYELKNILKHWVRSPKEGLQMIPTDSIVLKLDKEAIKRSGMLAPDSIPEYMHISLKGKHVLYKSELMMLEMLANANWERPIYMAITVGSENHLNLTNNFLQEGLAYRITPFDNVKLGRRLDSEKMYDNLMNKFKFGGIDNPDIYLDETVLRMCDTHRRMFVQLATQLIREGKKDKALKALDYCEKVIPSTTVRHDYVMSSSKEMAHDYIELGEHAKADNILRQLADNAVEYISWYMSLDDVRFTGAYEDCTRYFYILDDVCKEMELLKAPSTGKVMDSAAHYTQKFEQLYKLLEQRVGKK